MFGVPHELGHENASGAGVKISSGEPKIDRPLSSRTRRFGHEQGLALIVRDVEERKAELLTAGRFHLALHADAKVGSRGRASGSSSSRISGR